MEQQHGFVAKGEPGFTAQGESGLACRLCCSLYHRPHSYGLVLLLRTKDTLWWLTMLMQIGHGLVTDTQSQDTGFSLGL